MAKMLKGMTIKFQCSYGKVITYSWCNSDYIVGSSDADEFSIPKGMSMKLTADEQAIAIKLFSSIWDQVKKQEGVA